MGLTGRVGSGTFVGDDVDVGRGSCVLNGVLLDTGIVVARTVGDGAGTSVGRAAPVGSGRLVGAGSAFRLADVGSGPVSGWVMLVGCTAGLPGGCGAVTGWGVPAAPGTPVGLCTGLAFGVPLPPGTGVAGCDSTGPAVEGTGRYISCVGPGSCGKMDALVGFAVLIESAGWVGPGRVPGVLVITGSMVPGTGTGFTMGGLSSPSRERRKSRGALLIVVEAITSAMTTTARAGRLMFALRERAMRLSN